MKKKLWIFVISAVIICLVGILILISVSKRDELKKEPENNLVIKEDNHISGEDNTDETELIPEVEADDSKTDNNTNGHGTVKNNAVLDEGTTSTDEESEEKHPEEDPNTDTEDDTENSEPIELPFVPYEGDS